MIMSYSGDHSELTPDHGGGSTASLANVSAHPTTVAGMIPLGGGGDTDHTVDLKDLLAVVRSVTSKMSVLLKDVEQLKWAPFEDETTVQVCDRVLKHIQLTHHALIESEELLHGNFKSLQDKLERVLSHTRPVVDTRQKGDRKSLFENRDLQHQLRTQVMRNVESENARLHTEMDLQEKIDAIRILSLKNKQLIVEMTTLKTETARMVTKLERKNKEAEQRLVAMNAELKRTHDTTQKLKEMVELEKRKRRINSSPLPSDTEDNLPDRLTLDVPSRRNSMEPSVTLQLVPSSRGQPPKHAPVMTSLERRVFSVSDMMRKNQKLTQHLLKVTDDCLKLKEENSQLLSQVKKAEIETLYSFNVAKTNFTDRMELQKRLSQQKSENELIRRKMVRSASTWVDSKRKERLLEEEHRWSKISAVSLLGASHRAKTISPSRPRSLAVPRPRSIPVTHWAD